MKYYASKIFTFPQRLALMVLICNLSACGPAQSSRNVSPSGVSLERETQNKPFLSEVSKSFNSASTPGAETASPLPSSMIPDAKIQPTQTKDSPPPLSMAKEISSLQEVPNPSNSPEFPLSPAAVPAPATAETKDLRLLVVGDSHTEGIFGALLREKLLSRPNTLLRLVAATGSSINNWLYGYIPRLGFLDINELGQKMQPPSIPCPNGAPATCSPRQRIPLLTELLSETRPQITIIALGTNNLPDHPRTRMLKDPNLKMSESQYKQAVEIFKQNSAALISKMIKEVTASQSKCVWISPPHPAAINKYKLTDEALVDIDLALKSLENQCAVYWGSSKFSPHNADATHDGLHFSRASDAPVLEKWTAEAALFISNSVGH